jgi:ribonuclease T2
MLRSAVRIAAIAAALWLSLQVTAAQNGGTGAGLRPGLGNTLATGAAPDRRPNEPGRFDFYILSLSWSPSFCEASRERNANHAPDQQCGARPFSFVVHGLWPQYDRGFPSYCQVPAPRLSRKIVGSMLELMPSPRLIYHEWDRHGTCSGLPQDAFFENVRKARAAVNIPDRFVAIAAPLIVTPGDVVDAFVAANPGLSRDGVAVACDGKWLNEVRVCFNKDLSFRDCGEVARRSCRRDTIVMPPVRGSRAAAAVNPTVTVSLIRH